ncbi:hypothetical protein HZC53_03690 [Candidatus Uhrbacteria bacterium]|nr:hypothetical protein [Candidatus Uhrbacteria bacterium]
MESNASTSRYILTALCIILVITAFILVGLNALNIENRLGIKILPSPTNAQLQEQYKKGYLAAREKIAPLCPMVNRSGNSLSGTVKSVSGNTLTVEQKTFDTDETVDGVSNIRKVTLSANTPIQLLASKPQDVLSKELADFKPDPKNPSNPPSPFTITTIRVSDIKVGDAVTITSNKDLRLMAEFAATMVQVSR